MMVLWGDGVIEGRRIRKGAVTALICVMAVAFICIAYELAIRQHYHLTASQYDMPAWLANTATLRVPPPKPRFRIEIIPLPQRPQPVPQFRVYRIGFAPSAAANGKQLPMPPKAPPLSGDLCMAFPFDNGILVGPSRHCSRGNLKGVDYK